MIRRYSAFLIFLAGVTVLCGAQTAMTNDGVLKLLRAGVSDDLVAQTIQSQPAHFTTTAEDIVALKRAGATDRVIALVLQSNPAGLDLGMRVPAGSKVYVAPMDGGFETYFVAALHKKNVPVTVVTDRSKADFAITGVAESEKAGWSKILLTGSAESSEQASISVVNLRSGIVVFGYAVNKGSSAHGKQSTAEACAKHLKGKIESER